MSNMFDELMKALESVRVPTELLRIIDTIGVLPDEEVADMLREYNRPAQIHGVVCRVLQ